MPAMLSSRVRSPTETAASARHAGDAVIASQIADGNRGVGGK
jgi:hypothetical protein